MDTINLKIDFEPHFAYLFGASAAGRRTVNDLLHDIGAANGGYLIPYDRERSEAHFVAKVANALDRQVTYYLNMLSPNDNGRYLGDAYLKFLLKDAPATIDDPGTDMSAFFSWEDRQVEALRKKPGFENYVKRFVSKGKSFSHRRADTDPVISELQCVLLRLLRASSVSPLPVQYDSRFRIDRIRELAEHANEDTVAVDLKSRDKVSALFDSYYFDVLIDSIDASSKSVSVLMFYFAYDGRRRRAVTTRLVNSLIGAHKRGVRVTVVVDRDRDGEKYFTREINRNVVRKLASVGIDARQDSIEEVTHSKVVVIDGVRTFMGTHNFSNSSSYRYDELSVLVENRQLARTYEKIISAL